ncbi:hypothetical protein [Glycomyces salinus]|uniref:hypothetical protein n=1 Tax=Glycomyces salinus TaxID=980294 RepID=UPI0018ECF17D|nr:hypothetical protein [Glycomyces salinus]
MTSVSSTGGVTGMRAVLARAMPGIVGGLIGGIAFGVLMQVEGMLPMVAALIDQSAVGVGWVVHLVISAGLGLGYAIITGPLVKGVGSGLVTGAVWGVIWWVLGALILMPTFLGMGEMVFVVEAMQWKSLMGHLIFGLVLGGFFGIMAPKMLRQAAEKR